MIRAQKKVSGLFPMLFSRKIEQIITAHPAYLLLLPDHMARTLDTPTVSFEELSLRNIFYRELLADA